MNITTQNSKGSPSNSAKPAPDNFASKLQKMHPSDIGKVLLRIDSIIKKEPKNPKLFFDKGVALMRLKMYKEAAESLKRSIDLNPDSPPAHFQIASAFLEMGRLPLAKKGYEKAIDLNPNSSAAYFKLSIVLSKMGKNMDAIKDAEKAISLDPKRFHLHMNLGHIYVHLIRLDEARKCFEKAMELNPGALEIKQAIFNLERLQGNKEEAKKINTEILNDHPNDPRALRAFSELNKSDIDSNFAERLETSLLYHDYPDQARSELYFALGDVFGKLGDTEKSFKAFRQGNTILSRVHDYNENGEVMAGNFTREFFKNNKEYLGKDLGLKKYDFKPIFIIGMPRSGTSLTEQIISSHSQVFGAGELELMGKAVTEAKRATKNKIEMSFPEFKAQMNAIRESYYDELIKQGVTSNYFTDKMMYNFRFVGYIKEAFPEAKIINVRRHPMAICWSIFKHFLNGRGHAYKTTEKTLAGFYLMYSDLINFWKSELEDPFYSLVYEKLTEDQKSESQALLDFCGLEWEDQCLEFHESERVVRTFSNDQVRKKMYSGSSDAWKNYEVHLKELTDILDAQIKGYENTELVN